ETGKDLQALEGHTEAVNSLAFSPDGKALVTGGVDRKVRLYDLAAGGPAKPEMSGHNLVIHAVAFSPDGKLVASVGGDHIVRLWDAATGNVRLAVSPFRAAIFAVAFLPDSQTLAVGGAEPNAAKLISAADGAERQSFEGHGGAVTCLALTRD